MYTHLGLRLCFRVGLYGMKVGPLPRVLRSVKWPYRTSWIHCSSGWRKDEELENWRTNLVSWYTEGLAQQAAKERAAREEMDNTLPKFRYRESLLPRQFRLLELYRRVEEIAHPHEDYTLEGTLYVASMDDKTINYKAISYVWGDSAETESIYIDGSVKKITKNCASALRRLLLTAPAVRVWVDSICINQGNDVVALTERGQQVAVMDEIYGSALEVSISLGEGNAATRAMFRSLRNICTALVNLEQASTSEDISLKLGEYVNVVQEETPELELLDFTLRDMPWFSRAWVLQEVAVAKIATIQCGEDVMNFHDLAAVLNFTAYIPRSQLSVRMLGLAQFMQYHWGISIAIQAIAAGEDVDQRQFSLQNIVLSALGRLNATRPEDRIFSLYGLL
ncbi:heterokaryon incompatibility protein-domain-containing protein [Pyrenochaeta sp. MPI-SDFR-AT-0127]|nr:heterokaryon incompatibility protein-domain-containing protein [Pyrenochaeta sp. MPI-SDFR-AT-0127]